MLFETHGRTCKGCMIRKRKGNMFLIYKSYISLYTYHSPTSMTSPAYVVKFDNRLVLSKSWLVYANIYRLLTTFLMILCMNTSTFLIPVITFPESLQREMNARNPEFSELIYPKFLRRNK